MAVDIQLDPQPQVRRPARPAPTAHSVEPRNGLRWKRALVAAGLLASLSVAALPLVRRVSPKTQSKVLTHTIGRADLIVSVTEEGALESASNKEIKCKVKGANTVLWVVDTGTEVRSGDTLVRLDTSAIEDNISQQKIVYENALANHTTSESDVTVAKISITEYLEGTFRSEMATKEKDLVVAQSNLKAVTDSRDHAHRMFRKGYISTLEMESQEDGVKHAELEVKAKRIDLEVLEKFTKAKTVQELEAALRVAEARLASDTAALELEKARLAREEEQLENCIIRADVEGMVIYPSAAEWKEQPDIEEGAVVREDQILLIIPDLSQMQVNVGIHESKVDRLSVGLPSHVEVQDGFISGKVASVASVAKPAGWWSGNLVKYDATISLDENRSGLKPGMSAAVEIFLARHQDVLTIPVAAVVQDGGEFLCWIESDDGTVAKRQLKLGDSNDQFIVVEEGLNEGDRVVLNPIDVMDEAQKNALKPVQATNPFNDPKFSVDPTRTKPGADKARKSAEGKSAASPKKSTVQMAGATIIRRADKDGDGVLTVDEVSEQLKPEFSKYDGNADGQLDAAELDAIIKQRLQAGAGRKSGTSEQP